MEHFTYEELEGLFKQITKTEEKIMALWDAEQIQFTEQQAAESIDADRVIHFLGDLSASYTRLKINFRTMIEVEELKLKELSQAVLMILFLNNGSIVRG